MNYLSDKVGTIKRHINKEYTFTDYSVFEADQALAKAKEFASSILGKMVALPDETYYWLPKFINYVKETGKWMVYKPALGIWEEEDNEHRLYMIVCDIITCIQEKAETEHDLGYKLYAEEMIKSANKIDTLVKRLKKNILLTVSKDLYTQTRYRLFWNKDKAHMPNMLVMDMEADDFISSITPVKGADLADYHFTSICATPLSVNDYNEPQTWINALKTCMMNDDSKYEYFKKVLGYMMSPSNYAQALIWWLGEKGGNGKSTIFHTMQSVVGEAYAVNLNTRLILKTREVGYHVDDDLAMLDGKSLYFLNEVEEGVALRDNMVKKLTEGKGGEPIRPAYSKEYKIDIKGIPCVVCNTLPPIKAGTTLGSLFRRFVIVRFDYIFTDQADVNLNIDKDLEAEACDINTWLYMTYFENKGINITTKHTPAPTDFVATVETYQMSADGVTSFWKECITETGDDNDKMQYKAIFDAYANYMRCYRDEKPLTQASSLYKEAIGKLIYPLHTNVVHGVRMIHGIKVNDFYMTEVTHGLTPRG